MKKHHKITAPERDQIAWWLAGGITIREMARRLGKSLCKVLDYQTPLEVFTAYITGSVRIDS
jgi:DNA-binding CsgD family transcriptional regulator